MTPEMRGSGSRVVKVSDHGRHVMISGPVPLRTRRVGETCTLNLSRSQTSPRCCGSLERGFQLRCRPSHLAMVQNDEVCRPKALVYLNNATLIFTHRHLRCHHTLQIFMPWQLEVSTVFV
ncbi:uncharacterized protein TNCV_4543951 [Trichonephila clavipes]|nr:uncharacterized protein TNCV_4543951 [Trichonephila clavipes]